MTKRYTNRRPLPLTLSLSYGWVTGCAGSMAGPELGAVDVRGTTSD